ncbi:MAG TPA: hypothetical protein VMS32_10330 [Verrucomicrobiae bacterium]|jgi:hypothetical protein|nr:hypothetical protein [Verrucomicrobiae bacterium]
MKTRTAAILTLLLALALSSSGSAQTAPANPAQLAAITERGRRLEAYDQAAWHGTDAARAIAGPDRAGLKYFIARRTPTGWDVDFGDLRADGTAFLTVLEATSADGLHFTAQRFTPARADTGFLVTAANAIAVTEGSFRPIAQRRYNTAVLPNDDGTAYVYFYPAQTVSEIFPLGGDERYKVSADGKTILEDHRMHQIILDVAQSAPVGTTAVAGWHTDIFSNVPEDTDVFHVLARTPPTPDYVGAQGQMYKIAIDGTITYQGAAKQ